MDKDLLINKEIVEMIKYDARIRMLKKIAEYEGLCKVELLKELEKHFNHSGDNLYWLINNEYVKVIKQQSRKSKGRKRHHLFLTDKGREALTLLNNI